MGRHIVVLALALSVCGPVCGQQTGHYINGVEGIKCGSIPPPGLYLRDYNVFYRADEMTDGHGHDTHAGLDLEIYAVVPRLIWVSNWKFLGADFGMDMIVPVLNTNLEIGATDMHDDHFGFYDINFEPILLGWHGSQYDLGLGLSFWAPVGDYDTKEPALPGKNFWTGMLTFGGTYFFDADKTWAASILARYEVHSKNPETHVRPGRDLHFEWGLSKTVFKVVDVGAVGYCQWRVSNDEGPGVTWGHTRDRVYGIGPEVSTFIPPWKSFLSLRHEWEFDAEERPEGHITTLTFTKVF